jgi:hypothetical protein
VVVRARTHALHKAEASRAVHAEAKGVAGGGGRCSLLACFPKQCMPDKHPKHMESPDPCL